MNEILEQNIVFEQLSGMEKSYILEAFSLNRYYKSKLIFYRIDYVPIYKAMAKSIHRYKYDVNSAVRIHYALAKAGYISDFPENPFTLLLIQKVFHILIRY